MGITLKKSSDIDGAFFFLFSFYYFARRVVLMAEVKAAPRARHSLRFRFIAIVARRQISPPFSLPEFRLEPLYSCRRPK